TGTAPSFPPTATPAYSILATPDAVYVGTGQLLSFQLNGNATRGYSPPTVGIDPALRIHSTFPAFRDILKLGNTVVSACQCVSLTDPVGTRNVKSIVEIDATTGDWVHWAPSDFCNGQLSCPA